ncbi:3'-5' ssDNA/RNA exonuclease TatD-like [Ptychodera flava]|uniref:3'-5' ssDNA/RNA exonuclease TatD-like n=1 Tax=Ptychodera flava TaxID=63121 RepID=UPI003969CF08
MAAARYVRGTEPSQESPHPKAMDSHFHLDQTIKQLRKGSRVTTSAQLIKANPSIRPKIPVQVVGGVEVYCDTETFPEDLAREPGWKIAIGLHPKAAIGADNQVLQKIRRQVASPQVAALGEIGLDRIVGSDKWTRQEDIFRELQRMANPAKPVVLHLRGAAGDKHACGKHALALATIKEMCDSSQRIHIHNLAGQPRTLRRWRQVFHNCYLMMVTDFNDRQVEALARILLEMDSPYLMPRPDQRYNNPTYIGDMAQEVVRHRGGDIKRLLHEAMSNTRRLYGD